MFVLPCRLLGWVTALTVCSLLAAAEHHGLVKFGGLPVPGATVTATQADKRFTAITDQQGAYSFADLPDGVWTVRVEMLCFAPLEKEVAVTAQAPAPEWELKLLPLDQMGAVAPPPSPPTAATAAQALAAPPQPATPAPASGKNAKPSKAAAPQPANTASAFQRADLNASADAAKLAPDSASAGAQRGQPGAIRRFSDQRQREQRRLFALRAIGRVRQQPVPAVAIQRKPGPQFRQLLAECPAVFAHRPGHAQGPLHAGHGAALLGRAAQHSARDAARSERDR